MSSIATAKAINGADYVYYIDETKAKGKYIYTALGIPIKNWKHIFDRIKKFRLYIKSEYGIHLYKELHATKFVNGRGDFKNQITKYHRAEIFKLYLRTLAKESETGLHTFSSIHSNPTDALDWLVNRINNTARHNDYYALAFFDSGNEINTRKLLRKLRVRNGIPSKFGAWQDGAYIQNQPIEHIIADSMFIDSATDYMIQSVDFIAYSVKTFLEPSSNAKKYGLEHSYSAILRPIIFTKATKDNNLGIVGLKEHMLDCSLLK